MKKRIINWGILSTAKIGWEHVIPAIKKSKNSQVIALASRNLSRAKQLTKKFKIPKSYGSYKELYKDKDVDVIYNPLPNHLHIKSSIEACKNKKNLLLEKPLSLKSKDIDPLIKIASQNKVIVKEAFMVRHHPQWRWVKEYIKSGKIGSISSISTVFSYNNKNPKNIKIVLDAMYGSTNEQFGTSFRSRHVDKKYRYAGKTGTSQVRRITDKDRELDLDTSEIEYKNRDHALFVAFAPYDKPKYAISVLVEHGGSGSKAAAPLANKLIKKIIDRDKDREIIRKELKII